MVKKNIKYVFWLNSISISQVRIKKKQNKQINKIKLAAFLNPGETAK